MVIDKTVKTRKRLPNIIIIYFYCPWYSVPQGEIITIFIIIFIECKLILVEMMTKNIVFLELRRFLAYINFTNVLSFGTNVK